MRCLWLSADIPYPAHSGRRIYSGGMCDALAAAGVDVVGLGTVSEVPLPQNGSAVEWHPVAPAPPHRADVARKVVSRWPSSVNDRRTGPYRRALDAALGERRWDVAVIDFLAMSWTLPSLRAAGLPVAYISQNYESVLRTDVAIERPWRDPMKVPLLYDSFRVRRCEQRLVADSALITAVTESDAERFRGAGAANVLVATPGYSGATVADRTISTETPRRAVVVGSLLWHVKRRNLQQLAAAADPILARAGVELSIVGDTPPNFDPRTLGDFEALRFVGPVDSVDEHLAGARVGVISERGGGGFKLKALDYVFHRVPMVVLAGSMDGLPLRPGVDYLIAESEARVAEKVVELIENPAECQRMQESAFERCAGRFDWSSRGEALADALASVVAARSAAAG